MKKTVKAWAIIVNGEVALPNGVFANQEDAEKEYWRKDIDDVVRVTITYTLPAKRKEK